MTVHTDQRSIWGFDSALVHVPRRRQLMNTIRTYAGRDFCSFSAVTFLPLFQPNLMQQRPHQPAARAGHMWFASPQRKSYFLSCCMGVVCCRCKQAHDFCPAKRLIYKAINEEKTLFFLLQLLLLPKVILRESCVHLILSESCVHLRNIDE